MLWKALKWFGGKQMYSFLKPHTRFGGTVVPQSHAAWILAAGW